MNIVLAIYSENAFKEYPLPSLNNADYSITLKKDFFHFEENLNLQLEVLDFQWKIKTSTEYKALMNKQKYGGQVLEDGNVIQIVSAKKERVSILVRYVENIFHSFEKYYLGELKSITIGKEETNDILYTYLQLVSRNHAVIEKCPSGYKIVNKSKNGTYVNSQRIDGEHKLTFGDYINIMGLHMVYLGNILAIDMTGSNAQIRNKKLEPYIPAKPDRAIDENENEYSKGKQIYHRAPRNYEHAPKEAIEIEAPPQLNISKKQSLFMTIGPSVTMTIPMILGCVMMISSSQSTGGSSSMYMYSGLIMSVSSAIIGVGWALANLRYQNKEDKQQEKLRFEAYSQYLLEKTEEIKKKYAENTQLLEEMYPNADQCLDEERENGSLWNRNNTHTDYLQHRIGIGNLSFPISIEVPKKSFSIKKDVLAEKPLVIKENYETLYDVPITVDLGKHNLIGIVGGKEKEHAIEVAKCISAQIASNNCYTDVKMGFIYNKEMTNEEEKWKYAKWLPHVWSEDKKTRYIAADKEQASEVFYELTKIFRNRMEEKKDSVKKEEMPKPYYVLFISEAGMLDGELLAKYIFDKDRACGLTTIILTERYEELPNVCDFIIEYTEEFQGMYETTSSMGTRQKIEFDTVADEKLEKFARRLSKLQVQEIEKGGEIPGSLTFFEMLEVTRPEEIPVKELWAKNRTYDNIKGLVGQKAGGAPCYLDVHEKYHGPHGLVAGTTGSGKSETLQTYMMALAVNYSPDDIGFFIIDYKGGGMANLFSGLPHMVGSISNLSGNQVKRAMISIKSENRRRQRVFTEHGVNNINLYTKLYKNGEATYPIPHLFIIIDEFAELKREEPEFMKELISVAQVGRSLGVHLILATQKPSGTVDDNIWSNSKFRLCLRVQDKQDSNDMLHKPDAAYITQAGRCYLQVGNDEVYELFQSGYSGAAYEEEVQVGNTEIAKLVKLNGKTDMTGNSVKLSHKKKIEYTWVEKLVQVMTVALQNLDNTAETCVDNTEKSAELVVQMYDVMQQQQIEYPESKYNSDRLMELVELYVHVQNHHDPQKDFIDEMLEYAAFRKVKLPQRKEKTQLDAVKEHLAVVAEENGYNYHMQLWMPVLPSNIYLEDFSEYNECSYSKKGWSEHKGNWSLDFVLGKMDDPENQNQMPLIVDFAEDGHIAICGNVVSGKSTMMQTMAYALMQKYTPEMVNIYAIDFSSKMMSAFEDAPHIGGVMYEGDMEKIAKFFNMIHSILEERKILFRGGNYSQYIQLHGIKFPAIILFVDNYGSFKEKTEEAYEDMMIKLSKEGVSHGIFLVVSGAGFGINDITGRVGENINTTLCLSMQDKFEYMDLLHASQIEVLPEGGIKGRGLAYYDKRVLEYQTALALEADNDYQRMELIKEQCSSMKASWKGKTARKIPEIPKKPVWSEFHMLEEYEQKLQKPELLPVGYDASNAEIYSLDLSKIYCYLVCGAARTGRTNFMKICIQAALEKDAQVCIFDSPKQDFSIYADVEGITYATDEESIFTFFTELLPVFKARNVKKNELVKAECEDEEIYEEMKKEKPYFIFISDLCWFVNFIYNAECDMRGFLENILERGRLHNIFFLADLALENRSDISGYQIYENFISYKTGIHFGGKTGNNSILDFEYMPYMDREKAEKPGIGCLPDITMEGETEKVVIPMARR